MRSVDVTRIDATYACHPRDSRGCGAALPVSKVTCPECRKRQVRPNAPATTDPLSDVVLVEDGVPIALAASVSAESAGFIAAMTAWSIDNVQGSSLNGGVPRLSGLGDRQRMFGTLAPQALRHRYGCRRSTIARATDPARWQMVAAEAHDVIAQHLPEVAASNAEIAAKIDPQWKWAGTGWTSGVLNFTQLLPYHRDAGNLAHSWSAMIGARSGVRDGNLYLPEYDVTLAVDHRSLICFPGGDIVHGVTPMTVSRGGWRITAVFYGLRGCIGCRAGEAEIDRQSRRATERARIIARGQ